MGGVGSNPSELEGFRSKPSEQGPSFQGSGVPHSNAEPRIEMGNLGQDSSELDLTSSLTAGKLQQNTTSDDLIADGTTSINSFIMCSTIPRNMVVPPDTRHRCTALGGCNRHTSRRLDRSSAESAGSFTHEISLEEHTWAMETFCSNSDDVPVGEHAPDLESAL